MHLSLGLLRPFMKNQTPWISRTVMVQDNKVEEALQLLNKIMSREGLLKRYRLTRYYEKPCRTRQRVNYEKSKDIYDEDMRNKIRFVMRKNRMDPYPGA